MATDQRSGWDWGIALPNLLTLLRIPLAGLLWAAPRWPLWVLSILALAGLTDVLDGWLVRRWRRRRFADDHDPGAYAAHAARGAFLDGLADKVFVSSAVIALGVALDAPVVLLACLLARELAMVPLLGLSRVAPGLVRRDVDFSSGVPGKAATIAQFVALVLGFLQHPWFAPAAVVAGGLGLAAAAFYIARFLGWPAR